MEQSTQALSLEDSYKYASSLVRNRMLQESREDVLDLVQISVSELWSRHNSGKVEITSSIAYLSSIVHCRCIDLLRRRKGHIVLPLPLDADGEIYQGKPLFLSHEGIYQDPVRAFECKEFLEEIIARTVKLPDRQRYAMICVLKDEIDDTFPLVDVFKGYGIDIEPIHWPQEACELHRLRASLTFARKTLRSLQK
ncbi:MAG: hypothetical protein ABI456_07175 [Ktedonobacteraceae bacterium]